VPRRTSDYFFEIDGLRAIAVLSVMAFHLDNSWLPGGFAGVDIFFVISGYVVSKSLAERNYQGAGNYLLEFYQRRIVRLFPALMVMLVTVSVLTVLFIPASWLSTAVSKTGLYAFFGISNIALVLFDDGYFSPRTEFNPFAHTWSLGVEEQFYVVFPVLFLAWLCWSKKTGLAKIVAWSVLPILGLLSLFAAYDLDQSTSKWAYYSLFSRFWELAAGAVLYQFHAVGKLLPTSRIGASTLVWTGLATTLTGLIWSDGQHFPYPWALLSVSGTLMVIASVRFPGESQSYGHRILRQSTSVYLGRLSYSLYLWHWPVYTLMRWTVGLDGYLDKALALAITFILSIFSYHLIETKTQGISRRIMVRPSAKILIGLSCVVLMAFSSRALFSHRNHLSLSQTRDTYNWYPYAHAAERPGDPGAVFADRQIFVIGNSHADAYQYMLQQASQRLGLAVHIRNDGACSMAMILNPTKKLPGCEARQEDSLNVLKTKANPGDIVFFASLRTHRLTNQDKVRDPQEVLTYARSEFAHQQVSVAKAEAAELITRLEELDLQVLIDAPKPVLLLPPFRCSDWFNASNPVCKRGFYVERQFLLDIREPVMSALFELDTEHDNLHIWDPFPVLCPEDRCASFDEERLPFFYDGDHLSGHGNRVLYPSFTKVLKAIWQ